MRRQHILREVTGKLPDADLKRPHTKIHVSSDGKVHPQKKEEQLESVAVLEEEAKETLEVTEENVTPKPKKRRKRKSPYEDLSLKSDEDTD